MSAVKRLAVLGCAGLVASTAAACGSSGDGGSASAANASVTLGTTAVTTVYDPAGAYDLGSWLVLYNTHQTLLNFPAGATTPQPDAAKSCTFTGADAKTYKCTLNSGLTFSNGDSLTAEDVVFSFTRMKHIHDPSGPADALFDTLKSVESQGDNQVIFHLTEPDAVFPSKLASAAGAIVDHKVYPADKLLANDKMVGSGPYKLDGIDTMKTADGTAPGVVRLSANSDYRGSAQLNNNKFTLRYYQAPADLKSALDSGEVDLADNSLDPKDANKYKQDALAGSGAFKVVTGDSAETRYMAFNTKDPVVGQKAVRQAIAQLLDRKALARDGYDRTVQALYSVVPQGIIGSNTAFFDEYGDPSVAAARDILEKAHIQTPVSFSLTWSRARIDGAEGEQLKKQLESGGLFKVQVKRQSDWTSFQKGWQSGAYQAYTIGWSPDYPDPDNFIVPLVVKGGSYYTGWDDSRISGQLVPQTRKTADRSAAMEKLGKIQDIVADDAPLIPLWQSKAFFVSKGDITGVESTVDATGVIRFWEIGRIGH
ncbi:ABC transporter substrate-binding protein [Streptomyces sp. NPDC092296]|uniref:ABC transporter substrate-binding protein n=1 Tax=Streptomyces sp. NPDC092296 TaxID=3366012 RepID=UPI00382BF434